MSATRKKLFKYGFCVCYTTVMPVPSIGEIPRDYFSGASFVSDGTLETIINDIGQATRVVHQPIASASRGRVSPAAGPDPIIIGASLGLEYTAPATDALYTSFKVPSMHDGVYSAFHIHWTKSTDANEQDNVVRWQVEVTQTNGSSGDVSAAPTILTIDDTYTDSGTTTRIVHRTSDVSITFTPGWYANVRITNVGASTTLSGNPVLFSCDLRLSQEINR